MNNKGRTTADSSCHFEIAEETIAVDYQQVDTKHFHRENSGRMVVFDV
jgi:type 1 fimbria pilin